MRKSAAECASELIKYVQITKTMLVCLLVPSQLADRKENKGKKSFIVL
jgi:hypothetical protein